MSEAGTAPSGTLLLVDDEPANLDSLERIFAREGYRTLRAENAAAALDLLRTEPIDVVLTDLMMPGLSGQELLKGVRAVAPDAEVVLMTAYGTVEAAVAAMKDGAYDFLTKPLKRHAVLKSVAQALEKRRLVQENRQLRARLAGGASPIVGQSPALRATLDVIRQAAPSSATVLLLGESGTGKELFARALHEHSLRAQGPFVPINCAAIPESILESELFGYEKGAFTGAAQRKEGRIERAQSGTLFLDEVGELSPAVQVPLLADHFVARYAAKNGKPARALTGAALEALEAYSWPGNVRELENAIERAVVLSHGAELDVDALPQAVQDAARRGPRPAIPAALEGRTLTIPLG